MTTSLSSNLKIARGSWMRTFVSRTEFFFIDPVVARRRPKAVKAVISLRRACIGRHRPGSSVVGHETDALCSAVMARLAMALVLLCLVGCGARRTCYAPVQTVGGAPPHVQPYAPPSASAR